MKRLIITTTLLLMCTGFVTSDPYTDDLYHQVYRAGFIQAWVGEMIRAAVDNGPDEATASNLLFLANVLVSEANRLNEYLMAMAVPLRIDWAEQNDRLRVDVEALIQELRGEE